MSAHYSHDFRYEISFKLVFGGLTYFFLLFVVYDRQQGITTLPIEKVRRAMQKRRNATIPKNPESMEVLLSQMLDNSSFASVNFRKSLTEYDIYNNKLFEPYDFWDGGVDCDDVNFCVFSSKSIINYYEKNAYDRSNRHVLMDATFNVVPQGFFKQLLILHFKIDAKVCWH